MGVSEELGTPFFVGQHVYCKQKRRPSRAASEAKNEKERSTESTGLSSEERFSQSGGWILKTSDGPWFVCPERVSPLVIVPDRQPDQRHHHHGDDGRYNFRYHVALLVACCGVAGSTIINPREAESVAPSLPVAVVPWLEPATAASVAVVPRLEPATAASCGTPGRVAAAVDEVRVAQEASTVTRLRARRRWLCPWVDISTVVGISRLWLVGGPRVGVDT